MSSTFDQVDDILDQAADNKVQQDEQSYDNDVNDAAQDAEHPIDAVESGLDDVKDDIEKPFEEVDQGYDNAKGDVEGGFDDVTGDVVNDKDQEERAVAGDLDQDAQGRGF